MNRKKLAKKEIEGKKISGKRAKGVGNLKVHGVHYN